MPSKLYSLKNPTSIVLIVVIAVALFCAALLGGELYTRYSAQSMVTAMVECLIGDDASVSITTKPPVLVQAVTGRYTEITVATAGTQVRAARGMKVVVDIKDLRVHGSGGTIGSLSANAAWTDEGMKRTAQQAIPILGVLLEGAGS